MTSFFSHVVVTPSFSAGNPILIPEKIYMSMKSDEPTVPIYSDEANAKKYSWLFTGDRYGSDKVPGPGKWGNPDVGLAPTSTLA